MITSILSHKGNIKIQGLYNQTHNSLSLLPLTDNWNQRTINISDRLGGYVYGGLQMHMFNFI